jgi:hypothetical protein
VLVGNKLPIIRSIVTPQAINKHYKRYSHNVSPLRKIIYKLDDSKYTSKYQYRLSDKGEIYDIRSSIRYYRLRNRDILGPKRQRKVQVGKWMRRTKEIKMHWKSIFWNKTK